MFCPNMPRFRLAVSVVELLVMVFLLDNEDFRPQLQQLIQCLYGELIETGGFDLDILHAAILPKELGPRRREAVTARDTEKERARDVTHDVEVEDP